MIRASIFGLAILWFSAPALASDFTANDQGQIEFSLPSGGYHGSRSGGRAPFPQQVEKRPLKNAPFLSLPRKRESIAHLNDWIPAFAGMTAGD